MYALESRNNSLPRTLQKPQISKQYQVMDISNDLQQITNYIDILNQETDIYYLFDSFHTLLNSVKQAQQEEGKISLKQRQNTIDWWKLTSQSQSWAGLKNIKGIQNTPSKVNIVNDNSSTRHIGQVELQVFNEKDLDKQDRSLLSVFQLQNKFYKCHMGFCQIQKLEGRTININKLYIAKWYRKVGNYLDLITEFIKYITTQLQAHRIKIKINSTQGAQIKHLQALGFKLQQTIPLVNDLKIFTLILDKQ